MAKPTVSFRLPIDLIKDLEVCAKERGISRTCLLTEAIEKAVSPPKEEAFEKLSELPEVYLQLCEQQLALQRQQLEMIRKALGIPDGSASLY